jgi:histidinol-phosphatase (PHP family)
MIEEKKREDVYRMLKWDGHTHTPFCCHGSDAAQEQYIQRAVELGFERYTVSEHPPLPENWVRDPKLMEELAMTMDRLPLYFAEMKKIKEQFAGQIEVTIGLEIDYLYKSESFSEQMLDTWLQDLEDVIVSVHYLPGKEGNRCIDFTPDDFRDAFLDYYGSMDRIIDEYFNHVEMAIEWGKQIPVRKRIGHINLIEKFRQALPPFDDALMERRLRSLLPKLKDAGFGLDVNTAGMRVTTCGSIYVPEWLARECRQYGIPLVYGSDAHHPDHVGFGWDQFVKWGME